MNEDEEGAPALKLLDLPLQILHCVFEAAHHQHQAIPLCEHSRAVRKLDPRRVLPLVCRTFLLASRGADALWHTVCLNCLTLRGPNSVAYLIRWLAAHAPSLRALLLFGRPLPAAEHALRQQVDDLAAAVQLAKGLRRLALPPALCQPLLARLRPPWLSHLSQLEFSASSKERQHAAGQVVDGERRRALEALQALPALSELAVHSGLQAATLAACPLLCQRLHRLQYSQAYDDDGCSSDEDDELLQLQPGGGAAVRPALAAVAALTSLRALWLYNKNSFVLPGPLTTLCHLSSLHAAVRYPGDPIAVGAAMTALTGLAALRLQHACFEAPSCLGQLAALSTLWLVGGGTADADVIAGLAPATGLRALHLEAHASAAANPWRPEAWRQLGAALSAAGGVTRLGLAHNRLQELPPGSYLEHLRALDLSDNCLMPQGVPPALSRCTQLTALSLGQQEAAAPGETAGDVATLRALPALRLLVISSGHYSGGHLAVGLRSEAEVQHLATVREALTVPGSGGRAQSVTVTNRQQAWDRAVGGLHFGVELRGSSSGNGSAV